MNIRIRLILTYFLFFLICAGLTVQAQQPDGPKMVVKETEFDFKEVREGTTLEHAFRILNEGNRPLEIREVRPG